MVSGKVSPRVSGNSKASSPATVAKHLIVGLILGLYLGLHPDYLNKPTTKCGIEPSLHILMTCFKFIKSWNEFNEFELGCLTA